MTDLPSDHGRSSDHDSIRNALGSLQDFLDAWGGEPARWSAHDRARIERLIETTPGARSLLAEARALDQLIASARDLPARIDPETSRSLADRIMAAAAADGGGMAADGSAAARGSGGGAERSATVVAFPSGKRPSDKRPAAPLVSDLTREVAINARRPWQAAGVLAASLLIGLVMGGSLNMAPVVQELAEVAGLSTTIDTGISDDIGEDETL